MADAPVSLVGKAPEAHDLQHAPDIRRCESASTKKHNEKYDRAARKAAAAHKTSCTLGARVDQLVDAIKVARGKWQLQQRCGPSKQTYRSPSQTTPLLLLLEV